MPDPDESRTITGWRTASRFYRRTSSGGLWLALLAIPLLLGLLGWGLLDKSKKIDVNMPDLHAPSISVPDVNLPDVNLPNLKLPALGIPGALNILRNGNDFTLTGGLPDLSFKTDLIDRLKGLFGAGININADKLNIDPNLPKPDLGLLDGLLKSAIDIPDFNWKINGDTVTLIGAAPNADVKAAVEAAAKLAFPGMKIDNQISLPSTPEAPAPSESVAPAPAGGDCASLQQTVAGLLTTPINFETDGYTLTGSTQQMLSGVAEKIKGCADARVAVDGYTDSSGNDAINTPLSASRAKSVADYLVTQGVPADHVASQGHGSADPVASNDTAQGKAQNRRVEINIS